MFLNENTTNKEFYETYATAYFYSKLIFRQRRFLYGYYVFHAYVT